MLLNQETFIEEEINYPGKDTFPFGSTLKFDFGTSTSTAHNGFTKITTDSNYAPSIGYGWKNPEGISITAIDENTGEALRSDYIYGNNIRRTGTDSISYISYDCPTFVVDVPVGYYKVRLIQGSNTKDTCSGAYIEGSMNIVPWAADGFGTVFNIEPTKLIIHPAGTYGDNTATVAVWDGQLTIQIATSITPEGVSGTAVINAIEIQRIPHNITPDSAPRIRSIGDSLVATYPPFDHPENFTPIPEQTGWGGKLAEFFRGVTSDNWGVGAISARYYITQNFLNRFLLGLKPGDVVTVEWGSNEAAIGRRYLAPTATEFDVVIQLYIDAIRAYGGIPILVSTNYDNTDYSDRLKAVAAANNVGYVDFRTLWLDYKASRTPAQQGCLTVDGAHYTRVGGTVAGQLITYGIKNLTNPGLEKINALNISTPVTAADVPPTAIPDNFRVVRQTKSSITFAWDMPETTLYDPTQLITRFPIFRKEVGADDSTYTEVAEGTAYVTPDLTKPKLKITISSTGNGVYAIASRGVNGTGPKSAGLIVPTFIETAADIINNGIKYYNGLFSSDFTIQSFTALASAINKGKTALSADAGMDEAASDINAAICNLERKMEINLYEDFQSTAAANWDTIKDPSGDDMTYIISEDGDRYLNYSVSASSERSRRKTFAAVTADKVSIEFEWLPGEPDRRNVTELRFYGTIGAAASRDAWSAEKQDGTTSRDALRAMEPGEKTRPANDLFFGLKTANNGHIGYFAGSTVPPVTTSDILSPGVDLGLPNTNWYKIKMDFNFAQHTADLTVKTIDGTNESTVVKDIAIPSNVTALNYMRWHAARGKTNNGGNDLSVLWNTSMDDFAYYYFPANNAAGDTANLLKALAAAKALDSTIYTADSYAVLKNTIELADGVTKDFVISQKDVDYAIEALSNAINELATIHDKN